MINKWICLLSLFLIASFARAQVNNLVCNCPNSEITGIKADSTFHFSNGKAIVLCGYREPDSTPVRFSEFVIAVCGQTQIIDSWGATQSCWAKFQKDTLHISEIKYLPVGKDFKYISAKWSNEKIYFRKGKVVKEFAINKRIPKYRVDQINAVLAEYQNAKGEINDQKMNLVNKLFVATISGSRKSRIYFAEFKGKFKLDGHFSEDYKELAAMLKLWDLR